MGCTPETEHASVPEAQGRIQNNGGFHALSRFMGCLLRFLSAAFQAGASQLLLYERTMAV